jgi:Tfp pilus assembly protein PilN
MTPLPPYDDAMPVGALDAAPPAAAAGGTPPSGPGGLAGPTGPGLAGARLVMPGAPPPAGATLPPAAAPPAPLDETAIGPLNLARRPFINTRPVVRLAAILWLLGLLLLAANVALFLGYLNASQETRTRLASRQRELESERRAVQELRDDLASLRLDQQNREVAFLNRMIDERTFSWSLLFDRMADVLPDHVRLLRLTPTSLVQKETEAALLAGREPKPLPVVLSMSCEAKDDESVLLFVDNLFAHPAFAEPNLASEQREDNGQLKFEVTVQYLPNPSRRAGSAAAPRSPRRTLPPMVPEAPPLTAPGSAGGVLGSNGAPDSPGSLGSRGAGVPPPASSSPAGAGLVRVAPPAAPPPNLTADPDAQLPVQPETHPLGQPPGYRPGLVPSRPRRVVPPNTSGGDR